MSVESTHANGNKGKKTAIVVLCLAAVALSLLSLKSMLWPQGNAATSTRDLAVRGMAGSVPGGRQAPGTRGQITAISAESITIRTREGDAKTFTLSPATQLTVDLKPVAAAALKVGQRARIISADNKSATEVHVRTRPPGGRGGPGGASAIQGLV